MLLHLHLLQQGDQPTDVIAVRVSGHDHVHSPDIAVAQEGNDHASAIVESRASGTGVYDHRLAVGELQEGGVSLTYVQENHLQLALSDDSPPPHPGIQPAQQ